MIFLVPANVTGGIAGINENRYVTVFNIIANKNGCHMVVDGFCYKINYTKYITEGLIIFIIALIITFIIYTLLRKKEI